MAGRGASKPPLARAQSKPEDESIYKFADPGLRPGVLPRVKTYDVQPGAPSGSNSEQLQLPHVPNVRSKASHADSTQMDSVMNPGPGPSIRDAAPPRAGLKPPAHTRNNVAAVREASQLNQLRRISSMEREKSANQGFKAAPAPGSTAAARSSSAPNRRGLSSADAAAAASNNRNFLAENRAGAAAPAPRQKPMSAKSDAPVHKEFGRVPQYLLERKIEQIDAEEQRLIAKEAALIPPGMRLLGEQERQETLAILARNLEEVMRGMQALPFVTETPGQIRRKDDLERRLREIEEAQKIFSRTKVFVHL